jgi:GAF domain-containing protein
VTGPADARLRDALRAVAVRVEAARRLTPPAGGPVLQSIVDATAALFAAEAASIALYDAASGRLVFEVAAGERGRGVVGVSIEAGQGVAGYVFSTGQPIALSDVSADARFGRSTAERTGYVPRSLIAVPLVDDEGAIGVLEVLDKRGDGAFDLRDVELASVFARQATVAIRSARLQRDTGSLMRSALTAAGATDADVDAVVADAIEALEDDGTDPIWALADEISRLRSADPAELDLVRELLAVLVRRASQPHPGGVDRVRR